MKSEVATYAEDTIWINQYKTASNFIIKLSEWAAWLQI